MLKVVFLILLTFSSEALLQYIVKVRNRISKYLAAPRIVIFSTLTAQRITSGAMVALSVFLSYVLGILLFPKTT
jgi:hypothetical protein